jgi:hypothetical protein
MADIAKYLEDVKEHASAVNEAAVAKIVKHLGIALRSKDASLVSGSDQSELERVREKWLKKKLQLTQPDAELDAAVKAVVDGMAAKGAKLKQRVTVYYLLADKFGKLGTL